MDSVLFSKILEKIKRTPDDVRAYQDLRGLAAMEKLPDVEPYLIELSDLCGEALRKPLPGEVAQAIYEEHENVLKLLAPVHFESYLLLMEWDREPKAKFYPPRRRQLKPLVDALQDLAEQRLHLLCISLPPGVGKTTLAIFFLTWMAGRNPNEPMLTGSHSNSFVRGVYDECLRLMDPMGEYRFAEIFPGAPLASTNAKDCRIDLDKRQRFETLEFTSIGTGNAGLYRAEQLLYCDDLVSGIEVALSRDRLDKLWETYTTDLRQRKIGNHCGELHIATRWSVHDVIGHLEEIYHSDPAARFIAVPALDENDESNFDYDYGVGFGTEFYHMQRDIMDEVSWKALYMNEPVEREGRVYTEEELRRYFELPSAEPDAVIAACDTKDRGKDYCVMPVAYVYGQDYYIDDVICDNGLPDVVDARLVDCLVRGRVGSARFESNSAGGRIALKVQEGVKAQGGITHITTKYNTANKETRIIVASAWVKEHCLFRDPSVYKPGSEYGLFMRMLCSYSLAGRNAHDDVPDAIAQLAEYAQSLSGMQIEVFQRPW